MCLIKYLIKLVQVVLTEVAMRFDNTTFFFFVFLAILSIRI